MDETLGNQLMLSTLESFELRPLFSTSNLYMICINFLLSILLIHFLIVQKKVGLFHIEAQLFISHAL